MADKNKKNSFKKKVDVDKTASTYTSLYGTAQLNLTPEEKRRYLNPTPQEQTEDYLKHVYTKGSGRAEESISPMDLLGPAEVKAVISAMKSGAKVLPKVAKYVTTETALKDAYKINPWAFKPNEANWYRQVGESALDDAFQTGLVREVGEEVSPRMLQEFESQLSRMQGSGPEAMLASRRPASPFFGKGELFYPMDRKPIITKTGKLSKNSAGKGDAEYLIETLLPNESFQPAYVKGMSLGVPTEVGQTAILKPNPSLRTIDNFNFYKRDWLRGYKPIETPKELLSPSNITQKAQGGHLNTNKGKDFAEDRTTRGYYYYLGESDKSKLLDSLALAKSRLTPYAEGGFIEEEGDGPGTPKKSPAPKKAGIDKELLIRQQFKESSFDPKAKSGANARGLAQIMDEVEQDAKKAGILKKGEDIYNPEVNTRVQKWYMDNLYNSSFINKPGQKEDVKIAKALAAYNYGRGNVLKHLNEKKAAGVDIYNSFDWLKGLPTETTDYVNKILRKTDPSFEKQYNEAVKTYKYKAKGGSIEDDNKKVSEKDKTTVVRDYRGDTYYSPEEDTIYLSRFANEDVELPHELYHAQQAKSGRLRAPSYDPYGEARRKPSIAEEQDLVDYPYYNRSTEEQKLFLNRFLKNNPSFQFVNPEAVYNYQVNPAMYNNPRTAEGQARLAESPEGVDFLKRKGLWLEGYAKGGKLIKRADGSYSRRGLWDNIRANKGSGKKPTKEMLEQEAKIKAEYARGGEINLTTPDGEKHIIYKKESPTGNGKGKKGNIMVTHPTKDKGKWDTIDLTDITDGEVKTVAEGKKSTLKWHKENPETKAKGGWLNNYK